MKLQVFASLMSSTTDMEVKREEMQSRYLATIILCVSCQKD